MSLSVVLFIMTPVIPVTDDWLAFVVPISLGILKEYKMDSSAIHLTDVTEDSEHVQVNSTMSPGHGVSWLRPCRLTSCGITRDVRVYVPAPVSSLLFRFS